VAAAVTAQVEARGLALLPGLQALLDRGAARARAALGAAAAAAAWDRGRAMTIDDAVDGALASGPAPDGERRPAGTTPRRRRARPAALTPREDEVLRLLAAGRTNREIAGVLGVSVPTVARHVATIYGKLGLHGRAAAAAYAVRHGLLRGAGP
jgi:DNA-binding CsgD family transcriptional regulator